MPIFSEALKAVELMSQLKGWLDGPKEVSQEVLRLAYLEAKYNLVVLDVLPQKGHISHDDPKFFTYVDHLALDAITAFFLNWRKIEDNVKGVGGIRFSLSSIIGKDWEQEAQRVRDEAVAEDIKTLPQLTRYISTRARGLAALKDVHPEARRGLNLRLRLTNLRRALVEFVTQLEQREELKKLLGSE